MKKIVYNRSTCRVEPAERMTCPRCKGVGWCDKDEDKCVLCRGVGEVWRSTGGWTWPVGRNKYDCGRLY